MTLQPVPSVIFYYSLTLCISFPLLFHTALIISSHCSSTRMLCWDQILLSSPPSHSPTSSVNSSPQVIPALTEVSQCPVVPLRRFSLILYVSLLSAYVFLPLLPPFFHLIPFPFPFPVGLLYATSCARARSQGFARQCLDIPPHIPWYACLTPHSVILLFLYSLSQINLVSWFSSFARTTKTSLAYHWVESVCQWKEAFCRRLCFVYKVGVVNSCLFHISNFSSNM